MTDDSEKERRWLAERYASMPTAQLVQIASESDSLTDIARTLLDTEIKRRDDVPEIELTSPQTTPVPSDESLDGKLEMVRRYRDLPEALLAKGSLEAAGIECFLADDNMVRMDWFISNLLGGVKVLVRREDVADAISVLDEPIPENFEVEGVGEYHQPRCPQCDSLNIGPDLINPGWACSSCGHKWEGPAD